MKFDLNSKKNNFEKYAHVQSKLIIDTCPDLQPQVSIMIPTFKRPHLLKETINSAIEQKSDVIFEVVIVDNDACGEFSEELEELVNSYQNENIRYYRNLENIGMFGNWNRCIELARGKWITILNDDDTLLTDWLSAVYEEINRQSMIITGYKKVYSSREIAEYNVNYKHAKHIKVEEIKSRHQFSAHQSNGTLGILMEKQKALIIGGFDELLFPTADYNFNFIYWYKFGTYRVCNELALFRWEENESLKPEVMRGFLRNDYYMWKKYGNEIFKKSKAKRILIEYTSYIKTIKRAKNFSSVDDSFDADHELNKLKISPPKTIKLIINLLPSRLVYILLYLLE